MQKFELKIVLIVVALVAIIVGSYGAFDAYKQYTFRKSIASAWAEAPVSSTPVSIEDKNSIVICFDGDELTFESSLPEVELQKCDSGGDFRYDLSCSLGKFRITYYGDLYSEVASTVSPKARTFDVLRDALMLDNQSRASSSLLWTVRTQFIPVGCNDRLQHFETSQKMGFISGSKRPNTLMFLFDSSGEYSIGVLSLEAESPKWDELAGQIVLKKKPATAK